MPRSPGPGVCPEPGCPTITDNADRCATHAVRRYDHPERQRMRAAVAAHRARHGDWCPGWRRPAHAATDLTADHTTPIIDGGYGEDITVLCRSCNSTRGATQQAGRD